MKVFKNIGSKERLFEMFDNVNKTSLNEDMGSFLDPKQTLELSFEELKTGKLQVSQANTQVDGEETSVELICVDGANNTITFRFSAVAAESIDDGVFDFGEARLTSFSFDSESGESVDVQEGNLGEFNARYSAEMTEIVSNYADVEVDAPVDLEEVGKIIDSIPFAPSDEFDKIQTGKNYVDKKPVNPAIRVDATSLDKFVRETEDFLKMYPQHMPQQMKQDFNDARYGSDTGYYAMMSPEERMQITAQVALQLAKEYNVEPEVILSKSQYNEKAFQMVKDKVEAIVKEKRLAALNEKEVAEGDYPNPTPKDISPQSSYPKKRKKYDTKLRLKTGKPKATSIAEYDEEDDLLSGFDLPELPDDRGAERAARSDISKEPEFDNTGVDSLEWKHPLNKNTSFAFNEEDEEEKKDFDMGGDSPELEPEGGEEIGGEIKMSPEDNERMLNIAGIEKPKEEPADEPVGDQIDGGLADEDDAEGFDPKQVMLGMGVEMEHTDDPKIALEITLDHLKELPDYYTRLDKMEKDAKVGGEIEPDGEHPLADIMDVGDADSESLPMVAPENKGINVALDKGEPEEEKKDELLGFKPMNVGDYVDEGINESRVWTKQSFEKFLDEIMVGVKKELEKLSSKDEAKRRMEEFAGFLLSSEDGLEEWMKNRLDRSVTPKAYLVNAFMQYFKEPSFKDKIGNLFREEDVMDENEFSHQEQGKMEVRSFDEASAINFVSILNFLVNRRTKKIEAGYVGWNVPRGYIEKYSGPNNESDFVLVSNDALRSPRPYLEFPEGIDYTKKENWVR